MVVVQHGLLVMLVVVQQACVRGRGCVPARLDVADAVLTLGVVEVPAPAASTASSATARHLERRVLRRQGVAVVVVVVARGGVLPPVRLVAAPSLALEATPARASPVRLVVVVCAAGLGRGHGGGGGGPR